MNKQYVSYGLLLAAALGLSADAFAPAMTFPRGPMSGNARMAAVAVQAIGFGAAVAFLGELSSRGLSTDVSQGRIVGGVIGGVFGALSGLEYFFTHSPRGCVKKFNEAYNYFLSSEILREGDSYWREGRYSDHWPLVELQDRMVACKGDLERAIAFGRSLNASPLIHGLGEDVSRSIMQKVNVLVSMLGLVKGRMAIIQAHPGYAMQLEMKKYNEQAERNAAAQREYLRLQKELAAMREQDRAYWSHASLPMPAPTAPVYNQFAASATKQCGLCGGNIPVGQSYKTSCVCPAGKNLYHHLCISTHMRDAHACPKCHVAGATVHLDAPNGSVSNVQFPIIPLLPSPSAPPAVDMAYTCALCTGTIQPTKRYRTECDCSAGKYYYHHECVAGTLKTNGNQCPKCHKPGATVRSAF